MNPRLTVGITSFNEANNIKNLLDRLAVLDETCIQVVLYDDASTDGTAALISDHAILIKPNFTAHLAEMNFGSPSKGRRYIVEQSKSSYVTFVDGDDLIDPKALTSLVKSLPQGFDMIVTPFMIGELRIFPKSFDNEKPISSETISRILSGIGGKIYNREALRLHIHDEVMGRSEDVRLNMRLLLGGFERVHIEAFDPFYFIAASRKSTLSKNILLPEIAARIKNYQILQERYGVDDTYLQALRRNLLKVVREDPSLTEQERQEHIAALQEIMPYRLETIIHLIQDLSVIGGVPGRVKHTVAAARGRDIRHICLSTHPDPTRSLPDALCAADDEEAVLAFLRNCHGANTVVITPNSVIRGFSDRVREQLRRLPLLHMASDQLSCTLQDSAALADLDFTNTYRVSRILCLSDMDMSFHRQMGIHELTKIRLPVATRSTNTYSLDKNRFVTYVGRIDFHAKGAERLVPIAKLMRERGLGPLRIFTTDSLNSPDLPAFIALLSEAGLSDWVEITFNVTDKPTLYGEASVVLLPSKKESFGKVILEAFSFGVPVIAPSYAPGPAEVIRHGEDGFLLDEFSAEAVLELLEGLSPERLSGMSQAAFARHHDYSMEQYLTSLETIAADTALAFPGKNKIRPFPRIEAAAVLGARLKEARRQIRLMEKEVDSIKKTYSWRMTKPLRLIKGKLSRKP